MPISIGRFSLAYIEELVKALSHENPEIRVKVAGALKALKDVRATEPLMRAREENWRMPCTGLQMRGP